MTGSTGEAGVRLAADIGGTFTDVALTVSGRLRTTKVLTTPASPADAVLDGVGKVLADAAVSPADVDVFIHGTTLATNALIERRGARTGLLTTEGMRDSVEMAHENRFEQYDLYMRRPDPLVPRHRRVGIPQRHAADGTELLTLDEQAVREAALAFRADGVESVAVGYLHSYLNPDHERRTRDVISSVWPEVPVSISSDVCAEIREYERFSTVCANAYIAPLVGRYLTELDRQLRELGITAPTLLMQSGGGLGTLADALAMPVRLIESGPAGGALLAAQVADSLGIERALSFDMGGTTAKLCLIESGTPRTSREFEVGREYRYLPGSGLPLRLPVIEMVEIGAGGSSIAKIDQLGQIAVGPRSAGADPGPASYGLGGTHPTVTDADALLGRLLPHRFASGELVLDVGAAQKAVAAHLAGPAGIGSATATVGVSAVVDEHMANAARTHVSEQGSEPTGATIVAFGGAGPVHVAAVAAKLGVTDVVVAANAGVGSAVGFLRAPAAHESVRTRHGRVDELALPALRALVTEMEAESQQVVAAAAPGSETVTTLRALMRYRGQGHEISVPVDLEGLATADSDEVLRDQLSASFVRSYEQLYSRAIAGGDIEVLSWLLTVRTPLPPLDLEQPEPAAELAAPGGTSPVTDAETGATTEWSVFERAELPPGARLAGPALVVEDQTTTVVPAGATASVIGGGHLRVTLGGATTDADAGTTAAASSELAELRLAIQWNRLIGVVEEQARTLVRSAFSTSTREAGDLSAGIFDTSGRMLAQSVTGTPGHVNSMAYSVLHFLEQFPADTMRPGDVFLTNDPWKGTGHLFDIVVVTPAFHQGRLVALFACTSHVVDIGGLGFTTDANEVFHEGLYLPIMHFARDGVFDPTVVSIIEANVREPVQVVGDIYSLAACNDTGARRLTAMMDEYRLSDLDELAEHIITRSKRAMLNAIAELPKGTWKNQMRVDGIDHPVDLVCQMTVADDGIDVDFAGTSTQSRWGINVPMAYTDAYTSFGVRCIVGPHVPNNTGSLDVVRVSAPEGTILNAPHPAAVAARHVMGQMLPDTVFGCLAQAVPERVPAEGTSALWFVLASGAWQPPGRDGLERFILLSFHSGGAGARPQADGLSATAFPSGVRNMPVEVNELSSPLVFWRKEFRPDSGGVGRFRGGLGQVIELENRQGTDYTISATYERVDHPARGREGGGPGATGAVYIAAAAGGAAATPVNSKGRSAIAGGQRLVIEFPGGAGWGDPAERDPAAVAADRLAGYVSN